MNDVLIVGGGPVGLACALQMKRMGYRVTIYEKRTNYTTREQTMFLKPEELQFLGIELKPRMKLNQLQQTILDKIQDIPIIFQEVIDLDEIDVPRVILACGSKCALRDEIFGKPVEYAAPKSVVTYRYQSTMGSTLPHKWLSILPMLGGVAWEIVKNGTVSLFWEAPESINDSEIMNRLETYVKMRGDAPLTEPTYAKYKSILFKTYKFAIKHGTKTVYLVGDCAIGVPYFTSLQYGLSNLKHLTMDMNFYNQSMNDITKNQLIEAMVRTNILDGISTGLGLLGRIFKK